MNYTHVMDKVLNTPWLITQESLENLLHILDARITGNVSEEQLMFQPDELKISDPYADAGVGVLPINGPLFPKANMMTRMSGATSVEQLQSQFNQMLADPKIKSILLNIDSPGGMSDLIMEMGDTIYGARGIKPVIAVANTTAASAAYWLGSQADKFYVTPSGSVGSVGVYTVHQDTSAKQEKDGIKTTFVSAGKYKVERNPYGPLSEEAKSHMQASVDELYSEFIRAVARGRGTDEEVVKETYANGRTYNAKAALGMNMVDGIQTFDSIVGSAVEYASGYSPSAANVMFDVSLTNEEGKDEDMEFSAEMLETLGLGEGATAEEIETAVMQMSSDLAPLRNAVAKEVAFAEQFPEQAAQLAALRERDIATSAQLFTSGYEKFADGDMGFSSVALSQIEDLHKKVSLSQFTHDDLKSFLDTVAGGNAIVDYKEYGTSREEPVVLADTKQDAASKLASIARQMQVDAGGMSVMSWGDAIAKASAEHPELVQQYRGGGE